MSDTTNVNVIINQSEFEFLKDENLLTEQDLQAMIENHDLFDRFIWHTIRQIRYDMLNLQFKSKEEIEIRLETLMSLRKGLSKTVINYKQFKADLESKEENTKTQEQKEQYEALLKIKKSHHI